MKKENNKTSPLPQNDFSEKPTAPGKKSRRNSRNKSNDRNQQSQPHGRTNKGKNYYGSRRPKSTPNRIRVIPLGGVEEVGCNMIAIEVGNDIFVSDVGFEFANPVEMPGIEYLLPDTSYLEKKKSQIRGVFITHAHLDHIGGIPFLMDRIGNPPIYTREFTKKIIEKRQLEFYGRPKLNFKTIELNTREKLGGTYYSTFPVTHSIPDSFGVKFETRKGNIIISGDLKLDHNNGDPSAHEKEHFGNLGKEDNLLLIADSTNAERPGFSITEREVQENISEIVRGVKGRLFVGTFASQLSRIIKIIDDCKACGKKAFLEGRSIITNVEIACQMNLIDRADDTIISSADLHKFPAEKVVIICTGAQGEENATLTRIANHRHRSIKFMKGDTILLSSSVIPGNELAVQTLRDKLCVDQVKIIHYRSSDVHATGHGYAGELVWINKMIGAKYFLPAYGFRTMTSAHIDAVVEAGFPRENAILAENGTIIDLGGEQIKFSKERKSLGKMMVDGSRVDKHSPLIQDRQVLARNGLLITTLVMSTKPYKLVGSPQITTKGLSLIKSEAELVKLVEHAASNALNSNNGGTVQEKIRQVSEAISHRLTRGRCFERDKKPLIIPVVMTVS